MSNISVLFVAKVLVPVSLVFFLPFWLEPKTQLGFVVNLLLGLGLLLPAVWLLRRVTS